MEDDDVECDGDVQCKSDQCLAGTSGTCSLEDAATLGTIDMAGIMERMRWLVDRVTSDRWYAATVLPQLHTMIWGNLRGV